MAQYQYLFSEIKSVTNVPDINTQLTWVQLRGIEGLLAF